LHRSRFDLWVGNWRNQHLQIAICAGLLRNLIGVIDSSIKEMKRFAFLLLLPIVLMFAFAGHDRNAYYGLDRNAVAISDNVWVSKYEVSQGEYKLFLKDLEAHGDHARKLSCASDSTVWNIAGKTDPYSKFYHQHPSFDIYPVVGITHAAAVAYCAWMTETYGHQIRNHGHGSAASEQYVFRLPTEAEWLRAAGQGGPSAGLFPGGYAYPRDHKGRFVFNHKLGSGNFAGYAGGRGKDYEGYMITAPVTAFYPDRQGLHNMAGNVAEMLEVSGLAKGGSWSHLADDCRFESVQHYAQPTSWLGFRLVVERRTSERNER
jgi:formylglycine-generating enzyme required for sulfatase activity